jgi:hypothetical protein
MFDPALGKTREERAFGKDAKTKRAKEFYGTRKVERGMYSGRKASYGRYQVSETATDALNKSNRSA